MGMRLAEIMRVVKGTNWNHFHPALKVEYDVVVNIMWARFPARNYAISAWSCSGPEELGSVLREVVDDYEKKYDPTNRNPFACPDKWTVYPVNADKWVPPAPAALSSRKGKT
jgi:hypothetical protein